MSIGSNVRRMRRAKDLTQDQLAEKLGLSRAVIIQVEKNIRVPDVTVAKALAEELGCTLDQLCEDDAPALA